MKRPLNLLAAILGGLHLALCILFFAAFFSSHDLNRGMLIVIFIPIDPWFLLLSSAMEAISVNGGVAIVILAGFITILGTAQWWAIGWLIAKGYSRVFKREPKSGPEAV